MLDEIAPHVPADKLIISVAAGITTGFIERRLGVDVPVVRVMSNTPVLVDEAMSVISAGAFARPEHLARAEELLRPVGKVLRIPESQQDAATALSGSGPAYVYFLVEAMVDAGILLGMPRGTALEMVIQAVYGAATMLRETGEHPVILREAVTSPGGTTISAIRELERARGTGRGAGRDRGRPGPRPGTGRRMTCTLHVAWDDRLISYDFGPGHPLAPVRVELTMALARSLGVLDGAGVTVVAPSPASQEQLELVHDPRYIDAVRAAVPDPAFGLGTADNPVFPGMHEASALVAGATLAAAAAVHQGQAEHGVNVAGGLHHAMHRMASGFCVYNDPAIAIRWLLAAGVGRIGYVDIDVHHGDGVEAAFYGDPRVLTISLHEHPMTLFPGTGLPSDTGGPAADGHGGQRGAARGHRRRRLAARVRRGGAAAVAPVPPGHPGQPARLRHAPAGSAGPPGADHRRAAGGPPAAAPAGSRVRGRSLAAHRGRRVRAGPGGAADLDAPAGRGGRPAS